MILSAVPVFLLVADGYYQKDLKKGIVLFFLCLVFVFVGAFLVTIFRLKVIYIGFPIVITAFVVAHFVNKTKR